MTPGAPSSALAVVLVGPPGAGKSTVGAHLAEALGVTFRDTDADVERVASKSVAEIFVDDGEPRFRELEREAVLTALEEHHGVLALGGGAVMDPLTEQALVEHRAAGGVVVFLDVTLASASPRVGLNQSRPLLLGNPRKQWLELMEARRGVYERVSDIQVLTDDRGPRGIARELAERLGK
ncbi:MAG: shikimate kinase [Actinomycetales bacterium]|nr:shikimate kinase [Actinomycetales bacterium]